MKYEKCISCDQLGKTCDGPNLLLLDTVELGEWCNELRKNRPDMTYDRSAAEASLSKSAVHNFLNGTHPDCRLDTARRIARVYIGGNCDSPCGNITTSEKAAYEEELARCRLLLDENEKKIAFLKEQVRFKEDQMREKDDLLKERGVIIAERGAFMKRKDKYIVTLAIALALCLLVIIVALVIDRTNSGVGFFWLESLFRPGKNIFEILRT